MPVPLHNRGRKGPRDGTGGLVPPRSASRPRDRRDDARPPAGRAVGAGAARGAAAVAARPRWPRQGRTPAAGPRRWRRSGRRCRTPCRCAQVATGTGRPPCSVTPLSKPMSFIAIWPWSWYIVTTASKSPRRAATNTVSEGIGPARRRCPARARLRDRRRDDVDLLAPDRAAVAGVRIEAGDGDARLRATGGDEVAVHDLDRLDHAVGRDRVGDLAQRHVRRHPRRPQLAGDVELGDESLARRSAPAACAARPRACMPGQPQRVLVERREHDAVDFAGGGRLGRGLQRRQRGAPSRLRRHAGRDGGRAAGIHRAQRRPVDAVATHPRGLLRDPLAGREHRGIGEDHDLRRLAMFAGRASSFAASSGPMPLGSPGRKAMRGRVMIRFTRAVSRP